MPLSISCLSSPKCELNDFIQGTISPKSLEFTDEQVSALRGEIKGLIDAKSMSTDAEICVGLILQVATKIKDRTLREVFCKSLFIKEEPG